MMLLTMEGGVSGACLSGDDYKETTDFTNGTDYVFGYGK